MATFQFVDRIDASPSVRLDLNDGRPLYVKSDGLDISPPPLRRATVSTMLIHGQRIPATAWDNRIVKIPVQIASDNIDSAAVVLQQLGRELSRNTNILRVQFGSVPYFFKTFAAPDYTFQMLKLLMQTGSATLEIPAEPFAYGLPQVIPSTVVTNDASSGMVVDITDVKGDVETPAVITLTSSAFNVNDRIALLAVRRQPISSALNLQNEAESMTLGIDTSAQAGDGTMPTGFARTTFSTVTGMATRITGFLGNSASAVLRGRYRVFVRYRKSVASDTIRIQVQVSGVSNAPVTLPASTTLRYADLGTISIPTFADPVFDPSGNPLAVVPHSVVIQAARDNGTGNLDIDRIVYIPAAGPPSSPGDDHLAFVSIPNISSASVVVDGVSQMAYVVGSSGMSGVASVPFAGLFPMISPGSNRLYFMSNVGTAGPADSLSETTTVDVTYWPRYLMGRTPNS